MSSRVYFLFRLIYDILNQFSDFSLKIVEIKGLGLVLISMRTCLVPKLFRTKRLNKPNLHYFHFYLYRLIYYSQPVYHYCVIFIILIINVDFLQITMYNIS